MAMVVPFLIKHRFLVLAITCVLIAGSLFAAAAVDINYDLTKYLPEDSLTVRSIKVAEDEFGYSGMADLLVEDIEICDAVLLKSRLLEIDGVRAIMWLDDIVDLTMPAQTIPKEVLNEYYSDGSALFRIEFSESDYSMLTDRALDDIRTLTDSEGLKAYYGGTAQDAKSVRSIVDDEALGIAAVVIPLCILILIIASRSWIEPLIYLIVIGVSIAFNMGTNLLLGNVSFITFSMSAVLQLAISLDYSLFVFHRYVEERDRGVDYIPAITHAVKQSFTSVLGSALTTIAGFLALLFMSYTIGADMGLVLAKGVALSFLSVIFIMPVVLYFLRKVIDRTAHRNFMPSLSRMSRMTVRLRYVFVVAGVLLLVVSFLAQRQNHFLYGDTSADIEQNKYDVESDSFIIAERFGAYNPMSLMIPVGEPQKEAELSREISGISGVKSVISLPTVVDPSLPKELIPPETLSLFHSQRYARINIMLEEMGETPLNYDVVRKVHEIADSVYPGEWYLAGKASGLYDIRDSVEQDSLKVSLFSVLAVFLIVMITMKSVSIPVLLMAVIQGSIWINMGIPYFTDTSLLFIGYMIISALQLGATIDYAILISNRYREFRVGMAPKDAAASAVATAGVSVAVSSLILTVAGFAEGVLSGIPSVQAIGVLLGRGAAFSGIMVIFVLPGLLVLFDKVISHDPLSACRIGKRKV